MLFKDLRNGSLVYIIDSSEGLTVTPATIQTVSSPRFETLQGGQLASSRVIDVTVSAGSNQKMFVIPESMSDRVVSPNGTVIVCDDSILVSELKRIRLSAEASLREVDMLRLKVDKCDEYLAKYDVAYKEKQENENRLTSIEDSVKALSEMFARYIKKNDNK